jgi:SAM-dependent methyltransferase
MPSASSVYFGETAGSHEEQRTSDEIWAAEQRVIAPVLRQLLHNGVRVLDVAAGTGRWIDIYRDAGAVATLLDVSTDMLAIARRHARDKGLDISIVTGNVVEMRTLPWNDVMVATRFFNWIPLEEVETVLALAKSACICTFAFTVRYLDEDGTPALRQETFDHWNRRNAGVLNGSRPKGFYYLQSMRALGKTLARLGMRVTDTHVIERVRGEVYALFVVTA